jgi:hypothetical protein
MVYVKKNQTELVDYRRFGDLATGSEVWGIGIAKSHTYRK